VFLSFGCLLRQPPAGLRLQIETNFAAGCATPTAVRIEAMDKETVCEALASPFTDRIHRCDQLATHRALSNFVDCALSASVARYRGALIARAMRRTGFDFSAEIKCGKVAACVVLDTIGSRSHPSPKEKNTIPDGRCVPATKQEKSVRQVLIPRPCAAGSRVFAGPHHGSRAPVIDNRDDQNSVLRLASIEAADWRRCGIDPDAVSPTQR
jgi:hypothetical protein